MKKKVIIAGGGIAGMSAAHELIKRGFEVHVFEKQPVYVGGKARSVDVSGTGKDGRKDLPGEHGFRFFPGFYKHITATMKEIPFKNNRNGVLDNLVPTQRVMMARYGKAPLINVVNFPKSLADLKVMLNAIAHSNTGLTKTDVDTFADKLWQLMTSCYERRNSDYEKIGWWQYTDADNQSHAYQEYFVGGITRTLVAAKPKQVSTKTGGDILLQLIFLMANPSAHADRVLNGPTNDAWLYPWRDYLLKKGVKYHHDCTVKDFIMKGGSIEGVTFVNNDGKEEVASGDYYISAVPVEVMAKLISPEMKKIDATLGYIQELAPDTAWMTGIQFYLNEDVKLTKGHVMYTDSQWALTSISQIQFWDGFDVSKYGNGKVKGILSVDVSDWTTPGFNGKIAKDCTKEEIKDEIWLQLKKSLEVDGESMLKDEMLVDWFLDRDIQFDGEGEFKTRNEEPLLVNKVNTWALRPEAHTGISNLFLASDYVRTYTDLATMEGANEAARRAVNSIISVSGAKAKPCKIWKLHEPNVLSILRGVDKLRYEKGMPWKEEVPFFFRLMHNINHFFHKIF